MTLPRQRCYRCKGKGYIAPPVRFPFLAVVTLGITYLIEKSFTEKCSSCHGRGWLR